MVGRYLRTTIIALIVTGIGWADHPGSPTAVKVEPLLQRVHGYWLEIKQVKAGKVITDPFKLWGYGFLPTGRESWERRGESVLNRAEGNFLFDRYADPAHMDYVRRFRGQWYVQPGIIRFDGRKLIYVYHQPFKVSEKPKKTRNYPERPTSFEPTKKNQWIKSIFVPSTQYAQDVDELKKLKQRQKRSP